MGIIGFGKIGQATAGIAQALGMKVLAFDTSRKAAPERETCRDTKGGAITHAPAGELHPAGNTQEYTDLDTLLANSDVISLHCPLFPSTQGMINRETIAKMKDGVMIINTSRGGLIIEEDFVSTEPVRMDNPLLEAENIILTPHIAWAPKESRQRLMDAAADNLRAFLDGRAQNIVNSI